MNIFIPMGGVGSRFSKDGYRFPKPLVNIVGRPMLLWILDQLQFEKTEDVRQREEKHRNNRRKHKQTKERRGKGTDTNNP
jgi:NDP-sugar pyrophosphorylase family protein